MRFFPFFLLALSILGCVHTELPFDKIKISFVERKQQTVSLPSEIVPSETTLSEIIPSPITPSPELVKNPSISSPAVEVASIQEEKKEMPVSPVIVEEKKIPEHNILQKEELPENVEGQIQLVKGNYKIQKSVKIMRGSTLILSPGTKLSFQESGIVCEGTIQAKGTSMEPIVFEGTEGWDNITIIGEEAQGIFHHCEIRDGLGMEVYLSKDKKCLLQKGALAEGGAILYANQSKGEILHCTIKRNFAQSAVALIYSKNISIKNCNILQSEENGILNIETPCEII